MIQIISATPRDASDIERLLSRVYVAAGFTDAAVASELFRGDSVLGRGEVLVARESEKLAGMVIVVPPDSEARKLAEAGDAEMHLLAVAPEYRMVGLGGRLVEASLDKARFLGFERMILWTQPVMAAAQRLYVRHGFVRVEARDFERAGRSFLVFEREL